jgi:hypothetical protein
MTTPITQEMSDELDRGLKFAKAIYSVITSPDIRDYSFIDEERYRIAKNNAKFLTRQIPTIHASNNMKTVEIYLVRCIEAWNELIQVIEGQGPNLRSDIATEMLKKGVPFDTPVLTYIREGTPARLRLPPPSFEIARGQEAMILYTEIEDGERMVDFQGERDRFHRFYTKYIFDKFIRARGQNPMTRQPIKSGDVTEYTAKLVEPTEQTPVYPVREQGGRRKRKTRRMARRRITHRLKRF